jgi:hypothetical protein
MYALGVSVAVPWQWATSHVQPLTACQLCVLLSFQGVNACLLWAKWLDSGVS